MTLKENKGKVAYIGGQALNTEKLIKLFTNLKYN